MIRYLARTLAARVRAGRALFGLTLLGVALGVASVLSIQILNRNALGSFAGTVKAVSGEADLSVLGRGPTLDETLYPRILAVPGVAGAWPVHRVNVAVSGRRDSYLEIVGLDLFAPVRVPWQGRRDAQPGGEARGAGVAPDFTRALTVPGWVAVTPALAAERGWQVGDRVAVTSGSRRAALVIGALVDFQRVSPLASRRLAVMDIAQSQALFGADGAITQLDVRLAAGADRGAVAARLERALGASVQIVTPEQREAQAAGLLAAFRLNLTALSLISLFVGAFLVYESTLAALVRRRAEFGLLRSLGAGRVQILGLVLAEVGILGVLGVALGLPLGYWVAKANVHTVSATLSNLYLLEEIESLSLPPLIYLVAALVGIGGALAGALHPALEMSRRDTRALLAAFTLHERIEASAARLALAGVATLAVAGAWYAGFARGWRPAGFGLGLAVLVAVPLCAPLAIQWLTARLRVRRLGLTYGLKSVGARLQTTAFAVAALGVAVSMLFGITLLIGSFRRTVQTWIGATAQADIYVSPESWARGRAGATTDPALVAALAAHPGVRTSDRLRQLFVTVGERRIPLGGLDASLPGGEGRLVLQRGAARTAFRRLRDEGAVLIGEPLARKTGLGVGDSLVVFGPRGRAALPIAGVYADFTTEAGTATMDLAQMTRVFGPGPVNNVALYLESGRDVEATVDELRARFADAPLRIRSNRALREEILLIFDQTFAVTRLLQAMSLLIAVCGVALTLLVLARERVSELALYRALGAQRRQIFRVFVGKGLGMSALGLVLGAAGGVGLALVLVFLVNPAYFGWTIQMHWPWGALAGQSATILAAAVLASLYPALRASRTPATELTRDDL